MHASQPLFLLIVGVGFSKPTRIKLSESKILPNHWAMDNRSPSHHWAKRAVINNSSNPNRAVCIPPKCLIPKNKVRRETNVTKASAETGHPNYKALGWRYGG